MADKPTISWDETSPSGSQERALGAQRIREMKTQIRETFGEDHYILSSGQGDQWGAHKKTTLMVLTSNPLNEVNTGFLYAKDFSGKAELFWEDEDGTVLILTKAGQFIGGITGEIRIYRGLLANIPTGWLLCDGGGGSPNLVGKFIRGVATGGTNPGNTGGSDTAIIGENNVIAHNHQLTSYSGTAHAHLGYMNNEFATGTNDSIDSDYDNGIYDSEILVESDTYVSSHTHAPGMGGNGQSWDNRPVYLEEAYIIKT